MSAEAYRAWRARRADFSAGLAAREDEAVAQKRQRHYLRGEGAAPTAPVRFHQAKRQLKMPRR